MVNFLLLTLAFGLAHAEVNSFGKWDTIAVAADNVAKIEEGGPLRLYARELTCSEECNKLEVTFYVNANGQCSETKITGYRQEDGTYRTQYEGDGRFKPVHGISDNIVFICQNVDRAGQTTNLIYVIGKGQPLTPEQYEKLEEFAKEQNMPTENIRNVLATGPEQLAAGPDARESLEGAVSQRRATGQASRLLENPISTRVIFQNLHPIFLRNPPYDMTDDPIKKFLRR
ncbi:odorant-binding protein 1a-like [Microtus ochrogaster]|uniref:Odorant-binding protein 1a-like n=1 Tax=Microtus ochrogaster TaxID=79684 RepID=A0ABM0L4D9_MICOH|nr:odorant-binding protein 1a-like [Microtus ochrogaster]